MTSTTRTPRQRGQAMAEFIIALAVLVPMYLAVSYLGRYGDLQQRAQQASRYASFQRAAQPDAKQLSDATIADQMRARYFLTHDALSKDGQLRSDDSVAKFKDDKGQPALWRDLAGKALLKSPSQVTLSWSNASIGVANEKVGYVSGLVGKPIADGRLAMVELNLFNRLDLASNKPADLKIGAATAALGGGLGSSGSADTAAAAAKVNLSSRIIPNFVEQVLGLAIKLFERDAPDFGCIKPDVVAADPSSGTTRLDGAPNNSTCLK
ncbi:TadE family protein [Roseateles sp. DC23W]|uniref:TadE family protein n=1 Tax=Pelomonas dachongensis TaxID=3299029 RepID=A0ABW7EIL0_9BURK